MAALVVHQYDWALMREKGRWGHPTWQLLSPAGELAERKVENGERKKRTPASSKPKHPIQSFLYECEQRSRVQLRLLSCHAVGATPSSWLFHHHWRCMKAVTCCHSRAANLKRHLTLTE